MGASATVVTTVCRFCEVFEKEEAVVGSNHSCSDRVKYFKAPFRNEKYYLQAKRMHNAKWTKYCELETGAKKSFFNIGSSSISQATMHAFARPHSLPLRALIDKYIVDMIIGEMMFHP